MSREHREPLRVALVGGIYGKPEEYRRRFRITPETTLEEGLRGEGVEVVTFSHDEPVVGEFDIVHVHHLSWGALEAAVQRTRAAFVFTPHNGQDMAGRLQRSRQVAMRFTLNRADCVIALSEAEAGFQSRRYGLRGEVVTVIPNGIDARQYPMRRSNGAGSHGRWEVLYVGQLDPIKRVDLLLRASAAMSQPVNLTLVYQNDRLELEMKALARELGIEAQVHFLGLQNPERLCQLYNDCDLFVLPSSSEALPSVITEAMLTGTPLVATDTGGVRWQLGGFGRLIARDSLGELVAAMEDVFSHYGDYAMQCDAMAQFARKTYSREAMIAEHLRLYRKLHEQTVRQRGRVAVRLLSSCVGLLLKHRRRVTKGKPFHFETIASVSHIDS